jgi:uncharacterized membrane protein YkvA (DUF1232 family)
LKILDKKLNELGISIKDGIISADLNQIEKNIPNVYFKLNSLKIMDRALEIGIDEFVYSADKKVIKKKQEETKKADSYGMFRKKLLRKIPEKYKKVGEYAFILPDVVDLYYNLLKDKRVSAESKAVLIGIILYLASPIDFIPDFIPFIGETTASDTSNIIGHRIAKKASASHAPLSGSTPNPNITSIIIDGVKRLLLKLSNIFHLERLFRCEDLFSHGRSCQSPLIHL